MERAGIIGLGYVGSSLAQQASLAGFLVHGVDTDKSRLDSLSSKTVFASLSTELRLDDDVDVIVICVPTPVTDGKLPDLKYINDSLAAVGKVLQRGQLVVVESTVFPKYCDDIGRTILEEKSGLDAGTDFYLAHCPERVNPGDSKWSVSNIPRVIGGINDTSTKCAMKFYAKITSGQLYSVSNMAEAEASKMIENTFRDINIAFVNEMAKSFDGTDVNIYNVLQASATKPFGYMPFTPGMGVGGHCIPVDPHYLINSAKERGFTHSLLQLAREINDDMVDYVAEKISTYINENNLQNPRIGLFGLTYKPDVPDIRESQSIRLMDLLQSKKLAVKSYDPLVESDVASESELFKWANIIVTAVHHDSFIDFEAKINSQHNIGLVVDVAPMIGAERLQTAMYKGIGI